MRMKKKKWTMDEDYCDNSFNLRTIREQLKMLSPNDEPLAYSCLDDSQYSRCTTLANELNSKEGEKNRKYIHVSRDYADSLVFFVCVSWEQHTKELNKESPPLGWREELRKKKRDNACPAPISACHRKSMWRQRCLQCFRTCQYSRQNYKSCYRIGKHGNYYWQERQERTKMVYIQT